MTPVEQQLTPPGGWHRYGAPKIQPFDTRRMNPVMRLAHKVAGKYAERRVGMAKVPDVFLLLMRNKRLFQPWLRFAARLMPGGTLERKDSELVILRVGWNCRSRYEWGQHVIIGHYEMLAGVLNSVGLALEPPAEQRLAAAEIHS